MRITLLLTIICASSAFAQSAEMEFYTSKGIPTDEANSDYFMVGLKKDGKFIDSVFTYFTKSNQLRSVQIRDSKGDAQGVSTEYYENGKTKSIVNYKDGDIVGERREFYETGNLERIYAMEAAPVSDEEKFSMRLRIRQYWDSTGVQRIIDGEGVCGCREEEMEAFNVEGKVSGGLKVGVWKGYHKSGALAYEETYSDGMLQEGTRFLENQKIAYKYKDEMATYIGGLQQLASFISKNLRYPAEARKKGIQGVVFVAFVVDKDGTIYDAFAVKSPSPVISEEAVRVVNVMPRWNPGKYRGRPVKSRFVLPIRFKLER